MIETQQYNPAVEEFNSWNSLRSRFSPDGSHDLLNSESIVETSSTPFAFDLSREYDLAQEYGKNYKKYFIENAHYYAKESYGKVPVSEYEHKIITLGDGTSKLVLGPDNVSARQSYLAPALDMSKPEWYRKRSMADVRWVDSMQEKLADAKEGDTFIDLSPTEYNVTVEERKEWGYGDHSFARLHKVVLEDGQKKLVSRAVRNYLDSPEQEVLFQKLTGETVNTADLLGRVEKVNPAISQAYIKSLSEDLYEKTPSERKIVPLQESQASIKSEEEMNDSLSKIDVWLTAIYEMMLDGEDPETVLTKFRGWENAVKDYVDGKEVLEKFENINIAEMRTAIYDATSFLSEYVEREYEAGANGCGLGSGLNTVKRETGPMTYETMSGGKDEDKYGKREFDCPSCKKKIRRPVDTLVKKCPYSSCENPDAVAC